MARTRYPSNHEEAPLRALPAAALRAVVSEGYGLADLRADVLAGLVVGIVALPLAMALAIAVGVAPQHGLYTAIVAGLVIASLGGSRTQVSGPTAAFVVILAPIFARYGLAGLLMAGLIAGLILVGMGLLRMGKLIQFIPHPVTTGFTAGIATVIAVMQVKDLLGLRLEHTPEHFAERVVAFAEAAPTASFWELGVGLFTLALLLVVPRLTKRVPAPLVALPAAALLAIAIAHQAGVEVATIASRFHAEVGGRLLPGIPPVPPLPMLPWLAAGAGGQPLPFDLQTARALLSSAFAIAMLGAIESLLSAVVADGMARTRHDPDAELIAQGVGNLVVPFFGGIPATGAIARTATNIRSGGRSPFAAIVHALTVLAAVLFLAPALGYLPMSALAALLLLVAWNMSEVKHFLHTVRVAPRSDVAVLLTCFGLTVFFDMIIGVSVGMVLAAMLFMRRMADVTETQLVEKDHPDLPGPVPPGVVVYRVSGPLFFGAAQKAMAALSTVAHDVRVVILWLEGVPVLDATGLVALESAIAQLRSRNTTAILLGLRPQPRGVIERTDLLKRPGVILCAEPAEALRSATEIASRRGALGAIPAGLTAADVMRRDVTSIASGAPLREVVESMLVNGHRSLPVVDGGAVVGIITNGDLVQRGGLGARLELLRAMAWIDVRTELDGLAGSARKASEIMTPSPVTIEAATPLPRAAQLMTRRRLKRLPVVDEHGMLVGMLSRVDLLRAAAGLGRRGVDAPRAGGFPGDLPVERVMRGDVPAVAPEASLAEVLQAIVSTRLNKALVLDRERRVVGLVTDAELMDRMAGAQRPGLLRSLMKRAPFANPSPTGPLAAQHARARRAADLMVTGVPTAGPSTPLGEAIASMLRADRKVLAVVDENGRVLGIVDRADLLRGLVTRPDGTPSPTPAPIT